MSFNGGDTDGSGAAGNPVTRSVGESDQSRRIAYLDATLWGKLAAAQSPAEIAEYWLELQCCMLRGVARAAVYLTDGQQDGLTPAAFWPQRADGPTSLLNSARKAMAERKGVVSGHSADHAGNGALCCTAYPFLLGEVAYGAVAIELSDRGEDELRELMRSLQWGAGWFELALRRQQSAGAEHLLSRSAAALDMVGLILEEESYKTAAKGLVTELAGRVDCDLVVLGFLNREVMEVAAVSHSAEFGANMNMIRALSAAMQEATDQQTAVLFPRAEEGPYQVSRAHAELSAMLGGASVLSSPILVGDKVAGALLFERGGGRTFDQPAVDLCDGVAALCGPILEQKKREERHILVKARDALKRQCERLFGPEFLGRKIAFATTALLVILFSLLEGTYRISAPARIEGEIQRVIVAPFDGYIATQSARAGDRVREGEVLATLDDRDLSLEHTRWTTTRQQRLAEYDQMMAQKDRTGAKIARAQIEQADAHIALLEEQLSRTRLTSAFDALVVSGDLSQSVGAAVGRGEQLFELAPLDSYRVILEVDESQVLDIRPGSTGQLKVASLLDQTLGYTIKQIVPITEARDGRNFFRVEAVLDEGNASLRPGMEGVGKTEVDDRLLIEIWTRELVTWLRLKLWAWWP